MSTFLIYIDDNECIVIMTLIIVLLCFNCIFVYFQMPSTDSKASDVEVKYTQIFINNEWHKAAKGKTFPAINPSKGEEICQVEEGTRVRTFIYI